MAEYAVVFARSARRELERLEAGVARRIISRVEALAEDPRPHGCVKHKGPPTCGEFASETTASSTRSTTTLAEYEAVLTIRGLRVIEGRLPQRALALARAWGKLHVKDLERDWELAREHRPLRRIAPLE